MIYRYDGSFFGFLTLIFYGYPFLLDLDIRTDDGAMTFFESERFIHSEEDKAERVRKSLIENFTYDVYRDIIFVFHSFEEDKDRILGRTIRQLYDEGPRFLNSLDPSALAFQRYLKRIRRELHSYKGFLRLKEIQDGYLLGELEPENDLLPLLIDHFLRRLPGEKWILFDRKRHYCARHLHGVVDFFIPKATHMKETEKERYYQEAWKSFYDGVAIDERRSSKRMIQHMPKRYWKYLPEKD